MRVVDSFTKKTNKNLQMQTIITAIGSRSMEIETKKENGE
jgi:hypothetical protein